MSRAFCKPSLFAMHLDGPLLSDDLAALPDDELAAYLREHGYDEARQRALEAQERSENCENNEQF